MQAHGDETVELSHVVCVETTSEEQVQNDFDTADPNIVAWNVATVKDRHDECYRAPPAEGAPKPNKLSLTILRSCRQIYLEAKTIHYTNNTFDINCNDILERFVRARFQNKQNLAVRSLCLAVGVTHSSCVNAWSHTIDKALLRHLKSVRRLYLNLGQSYCACSIRVSGYEESEMTERQRKLLKKFSKLPLKEATLVIADEMFVTRLSVHDAWAGYGPLEQYRWTLKQKQDFSKEIRAALLGREVIEKGTPAMETAGL